MIRKASAVRRKRAPTRAAGRVRLRDEFRDYARGAILEAGEEVLASQGIYTARMEDVAQRARVAVGTIYNLIGDREALVSEILRVRHQELLTLLTDKLASVAAQPFREQALACMQAVLTYFREHSRFFRLVLESEGPNSPPKKPSHETSAALRALFRELIARGVQQNALRAEGSERFAVMLMGMMKAVVVHDVESHQDFSPDERAAEVLSVFMHGVARS